MTTLVELSKSKITEQHVYLQKKNNLYYWTSIGANLNKAHFLDHESFKHKRTDV